jgi:pantetheine-phosphate adenylyltransferase
LKKFKKVAVGGTFDHFHIGHEYLIKTALTIGTQVLIGLTTDKLLQTHPKKDTMQSYFDRKQAITCFIKNQCATKFSRIVPLDDFFGSSIRDPEIDALVVSTETQHRANLVNQIRLQKGFKPLKLIVIDLVLAKDKKPISATRIRNNEIDRFGNIL